MVYGYLDVSAVFMSHRTLPVEASRATRRASNVPTKPFLDKWPRLDSRRRSRPFSPLLRYFWVVAPDQSAIGSIQRIHNAPVAGHIHDAVNYQRSCLQPAVVIGIEVPIEAKVGDVVAVYLGQAAISLLIIIKPIAEPITFRWGSYPSRVYIA